MLGIKTETTRRMNLIIAVVVSSALMSNLVFYNEIGFGLSLLVGGGLIVLRIMNIREYGSR